LNLFEPGELVLQVQVGSLGKVVRELDQTKLQQPSVLSMRDSILVMEISVKYVFPTALMRILN